MTYRQALIATWIAIGSAAIGAAVAQSVRGPDTLPGCIYNASPPTLANGQSSTLQCDVNGNLKTKAS
jgi:hypothetical protein